MINATSAQLISAGSFDMTVRMTDPDAKTVMSDTPNVTLTVDTRTYSVYEVNPTVVPNVYLVRLRSALLGSVNPGVTVTFEV